MPGMGKTWSRKGWSWNRVGNTRHTARTDEQAVRKQKRSTQHLRNQTRTKCEETATLPIHGQRLLQTDERPTNRRKNIFSRTQGCLHWILLSTWGGLEWRLLSRRPTGLRKRSWSPHCESLDNQNGYVPEGTTNVPYCRRKNCGTKGPNLPKIS